MGAAGWSTKADAGALCGYEATGTVFLNAGTLAAHSGCFYLFNAPAAAQIMSVSTTLDYTKASAATALCAYSFAAVGGDTLRRCGAGTTANAVATSGANWFEMGIYNEGDSAIGLVTPRANNVVFANGWVTLSDPTAPGLAANGPSGVQTGLSAARSVGGLGSRERRALGRVCDRRRCAHRAARPGLLVAVRSRGERQRRDRPLGTRRRTACRDGLRGLLRRRRGAHRPARVHRRPQRARAAADPGRARPVGARTRLVGARADRAHADDADRRRRRDVADPRLRAVGRRRPRPDRSRRAAGGRAARPACSPSTAPTRSTSSSATPAVTARPRRARGCTGTVPPPRPGTMPSRRRSGSSRRATART